MLNVVESLFRGVSSPSPDCLMVWSRTAYIDIYFSHAMLSLYPPQAPMQMPDGPLGYLPLGIQPPLGIESSHVEYWPYNESAYANAVLQLIPAEFDSWGEASQNGRSSIHSTDRITDALIQYLLLNNTNPEYVQRTPCTGERRCSCFAVPAESELSVTTRTWTAYLEEQLRGVRNVQLRAIGLILACPTFEALLFLQGLER